MRLHPYAFKARLILFSGLIVRIIRNIRRIQELDAEITGPAQEISRLSAELEQLKARFVSSGKSLAKTKEIGSKEKAGLKRAKAIKREIEKRDKRIWRSVRYFNKIARKELGSFRNIMIDDETLLFKGALYLEHLFYLIEKSKTITDERKKRLLEELKREADGLERKASFVVLESKYLERGGMNTVAISEMSAFSSASLSSFIRRRAIEIHVLRKRIKNLERTGNIEGIFSDFEREIMDIADIGKKTGVLMRRASAYLRSIRPKLKTKQLLREMDKAGLLFNAALHRLKRISQQLGAEVGQRSKKIKGMAEEKRAKLNAELSENWKGVMEARKEMAEFKAAQNEFQKQK